ncbi:DEAD/DEAH box helicase [Nocardia seriolae]|uniref:DNA helicase n=2 Tax=Nocardia seriolae TaxID=37332 RepID=A0A0B8NHW0_9NOCA|nr:DEAD/DEAH box helicase [Nocardia seriolae]MTJ61890.1 DNA helicase [Nocardia seriolae]MTJ76431.1 DNA helicase [Nocardia seriolae]MTJ90074.1 DNA helicase [Nocardia seriolae]MTK34041.1 DNA helicase [Nocardia seriolae]MTK39842.1 DNA helicase [Nocardia seriolae]
MTDLGSRPSLRLGFDVTRTRVELRTLPGLQDDFAQLAARIATSGQRGPVSAEVDLDDFLVNLSELASWVHPGVDWDADLMALVNGVLDDSDTVQRNLEASPGEPTGGVESHEVAGLLGTDWIADLTHFQRRDIARLLSLRHGANFSVPGAGKTRVALAVYAAMRGRVEAQRLLVVGPKSAYESWEYESSVCFKEPPRVAVTGRNDDPLAEIRIVNYERLERSLGSLAAWLRSAPSMVVLDEAHRMKLGASGAYGSACLALGPLADRRLILTGTPAPNGAKDLENLLSFVWPGHGKRVVTEAVGGGDLAHASTVLRPLFTRTTKHELGLPPFEPRVRYLDMPPVHAEIYEALKGNFSARAEGSRGNIEALGKAMLRLLMAATSPALLLEGASRYEPLEYQLPPLTPTPGETLFELLQNLPQYELSPKYQETLKIVSDNADKGRKTLVWTTFVRSLTTLEKLLEGYAPAVVYGGTADREDQLRRFREDPNCHVLISNPATLGEGISLHHACHDAVYVDRDFLAGRFLQSLDRIHRLGLTPGTETRVTILATRNTVDEVVRVRLEEKLEFMGRILDDPGVQQLADLQEEPAAGAGMDAADVRALLRHLETSAG